MKFYAFNDNGGDKLNLILDHNTTATVMWKSSNSNVSGPNELLTQLKADTSSWNGTITPSNYTMNQTGQTSNAKYTIDYSTYKARLITAQEIATITNNTTWDEITANSMYYLDTNTTSVSETCQSGNTSGCSYGWLYDRTSRSCVEYGCLNNSNQETSGYWTVSPISYYSFAAWLVRPAGSLGNASTRIFGYYGVRPVIKISSSQNTIKRLT